MFHLISSLLSVAQNTWAYMSNTTACHSSPSNATVSWYFGLFLKKSLLLSR